MTLYVCIRVPKSGSSSLGQIVAAAFAGRKQFVLPNTLDLDGRVSFAQRLRAYRSRVRTLVRQYRALSLDQAFSRIRAEAADGDLVHGGHIDFASALEALGPDVKIITLLRDPYARAVSEYNYSRQGFLEKAPLARMDASVLSQAAAKYNFAGYLEFLIEHKEIYGNVAAKYLAWNGAGDLSAFERTHIFHWGVLERTERFTAGLGRRTGVIVEFPHENRTRRVEVSSITQDERRRIEALYPLDFELYARAAMA